MSEADELCFVCGEVIGYDDPHLDEEGHLYHDACCPTCKEETDD